MSHSDQLSHSEQSEPPSLPAIVLAAGASRRLGRPKQLLRLPAFAPETLLERTIRLAREAGANPIFVVLGANADAIERGCRLQNCVVLRNADWPEGMGSSLRLGISAVMEQSPNATGVLLLVCDQPALSEMHLRRLLDVHRNRPQSIAASHYAGRAGVPAVLPRATFPSVLKLTGDQGARAIFKETELPIETIDFPGGEWDIDTAQDWKRFT